MYDNTFLVTQLSDTFHTLVHDEGMKISPLWEACGSFFSVMSQYDGNMRILRSHGVQPATFVCLEDGSNAPTAVTPHACRVISLRAIYHLLNDS